MFCITWRMKNCAKIASKTAFPNGSLPQRAEHKGSAFWTVRALQMYRKCVGAVGFLFPLDKVVPGPAINSDPVSRTGPESVNMQGGEDVAQSSRLIQSAAGEPLTTPSFSRAIESVSELNAKQQHIVAQSIRETMGKTVKGALRTSGGTWGG
ncbi:hypothetical protein KIL84_004696 [Mauremys mutica]|uniref:Uncharacterized protein n=1 Tax=Mauremys mutica TaxID=74926 RepID=A0A9D3XKL6_9SAUR|nr:hypothetical protein KIL84_004696 [Mauremys mutica]